MLKSAFLDDTRWVALLLGVCLFALLSVVPDPFRETYENIPIIIDGSLLSAGASWQDWFTQGASHYFKTYPDLPPYGTSGTDNAFTRPFFQFIIYVAHSALGRDWDSYQLINCAAVAAMGALAFYIARSILALSSGSSFIAALLVVLSPPVLDSWLYGVAYAIEPVATVFVAGAFVAIYHRRHVLCLMLLFLAVLTKENAIWAPFAAAMTVMLCPKPNQSFRRQATSAAAMLLPVAAWFVLRLAFFNGVGGTYVTARLTPAIEYLNIILFKVTHLHHVFLSHPERWEGVPEGMGLSTLDKAAAIILFALILFWALHALRETHQSFWAGDLQARDPSQNALVLVTLWAVLALIFYLLIPLPFRRYATYVVVFAWPALVAVIEMRRRAILWLGLVVLCLGSLIQSSYRIFEWYTATGRDYYGALKVVLHEIPPQIKEVYVLSVHSLPQANPEYVRIFWGVPAEVIRIADVYWNCDRASEPIAYEKSNRNGAASVKFTLPQCADFLLPTKRMKRTVHNRFLRGDTISYEFPQTAAINTANSKIWTQRVGQQITVDITPKTPARVVIERGAGEGFSWFDIPFP